MTSKSTIACFVLAIASAGVIGVAWWWTSLPASNRSLSVCTSKGSFVQNDLPGSWPVGRMSLPWVVARAPAASAAGADAPMSAGPIATASMLPPSASLPWGSPSVAQGEAVEVISTQPAGEAAIPSVAQVAARLKFSPAVENWLGSWEQRVRSNDPAASKNVAGFESLLAAEKATVGQLLALIQATRMLDDNPVDRHTTPYPPVSGAIACRAVIVGTEQVQRDEKRRYQTMTSIAPLIERLWHGPPQRDVLAVEAFYATLAMQQPQGSNDWHRGRLGRIEAIALQGRYQDAVAAADALLNEIPNMTTAKAAPVWYAKGQALYDAKQYAAAATALRRGICDGLQATKRGHARALLVMSLARSGQADKAEEAYQQLCTSRDPCIISAQAFLVMRSSIGDQPN